MVGLLGLVATVSVLRVTGVLSLDALASSPHQLAEGKLWLLVTSAVVIQGPLVPGLLGFAALAIAALVVLPSRVLLLSAVLGQLCSTALAYLGLGLVRLVLPEAFRFLITAPDYGVSAIAAAWLGAIAAQSWSRHGSSRRGRLATVLFVVAVTVFGWTLRRDLNALDSEHVLAFAIGVSLAVGLPRVVLGRSRQPATA